MSTADESATPYETYEVEQPWVIYTYPYTDAECDRRGLLAHVVMECIVCGDTEDWTVKAGEEPKPQVNGYAAERVDFLLTHRHPDRGSPMSWARPLRNVAAHPGGMDVDALAMRLEADINEAQDSAGSPEVHP